MTNKNSPFRIPLHNWGYLSLFLWGTVFLFLLRQDPYHLDEGAAQSLLLSWSIADQVASSVVTFGAPDLRLFLYLPIGVLWTGNIFAAKILTVLLLAAMTRLLFVWQKQNSDSECALLASGLLILSPLSLEQIDSLSPGIYVLLSFILGSWLDTAYRLDPRPFGGWFFAQLFVSAVSVSLHPIGLAYPLALLWTWHKEPVNLSQQKYFYLGVSFVVLLTLIIKAGWAQLTWLQNPITNLAPVILGYSALDDMTVAHWISGSVLLIALICVIALQYRKLLSNIFGRSLIIAAGLGAIICDSTWSYIALVIILFSGIPILLRSQQFAGGFFQQRGIALFLVVIFSTLFMYSDKIHYLINQNGTLSVQDQLIKILAEDVQSARTSVNKSEIDQVDLPLIRVASQWPSRTMIACKCDTLPLPPVTEDPQLQSKMLGSLTYLLFDPQHPDNLELSRNLAMLGGSATETIALQQGGVLIRIKSPSSPAIGDK